MHIVLSIQEFGVTAELYRRATNMDITKSVIGHSKNVTLMNVEGPSSTDLTDQIEP